MGPATRCCWSSGLGSPSLWSQNWVSPFKDMILCFSQEDWSLLDPAQTGFYGEFIIGEDCGMTLPPSKTPAPHPRGSHSTCLGQP